jgi:glutathione synthase
MKIALLINETECIELDNYYLFSHQLLALGHSVFLCCIDSLGMSNAQVTAQGFQANSDLVRVEQPFGEIACTEVDLNRFDLVWILALGFRTGFLDKVQLLHNLERETILVNSLDSILYLKSKYFLNTLPDIFSHPESHASASWKQLYGIIQQGGGTWIIKPPAGSFGRDVFKVEATDANLRSILQTMTNHDTGVYCLIQRYVDEISNGEKRVLIANGEVVGQYCRRNTQDHRTNLAQGGEAEVCALTAEEIDLCRKIGEFLRNEGALFVAMDLAYPYVIELNVINPGGLTTLRTLSDTDLSREVVNRVLAGVADNMGKIA